MNGRKVRIATRGSVLARAQTRLVAERLTAEHPDVMLDVVTVQTRGDQECHSPLWKLEGYGFFTTQVEETLLDGRADIAVHSFKDMPTQMDERLMVAAIFERHFPEDAVVAADRIGSIADIPKGAKVGTSSPRRIAQLKAMRPDFELLPLRGNVETRLRKVQEGEYNAVVLARAGLERLGLSGQVAFYFNPAEFIPAPAQGALAVQIRKDDTVMRELAACLHHEPTAISVRAERGVLSALHPGCHAPLGVYARLREEVLEIFALAASLEGYPILRRKVSGGKDEGKRLVNELVEQLRRDGVEAILKPFEDHQ
jgi:hydroxymethylbilane synthase